MPILRTGAYVIYNKASEMVLHAKYDAVDPYDSITLKARDENRYFAEQIWWVERCPGSNNFNTNPKYLITNKSSNKCLSRGKIYALLAESIGAKQEMWCFLVGEDDDESG